MCGIAGLITSESNGISVDQLKSMSDVLTHRGPDDEGRWRRDDGRVGLAHRRLSIIDLSEHGRQPMQSSDGQLILTFNGEIYNYLELKSKLKALGYNFKTQTDTEVLLVMYQHYGAEMLSHLDGMFAFAIWDQQRQKLFCARDRFGEKPFFYYRDGDKFVFGSEAKAIWASGVRKSVNLDKRKLYVDRAVLRTPQTVTETMFEGIHILDAAHFLEVGLDMDVKISPYWSLDGIEINDDISFNEATARFRELFVDSVDKRLRADVPVGSSLSGGIDSSSIVSAVDGLREAGVQQNTFTARFPGFAKMKGVSLN